MMGAGGTTQGAGVFFRGKREEISMKILGAALMAIGIVAMSMGIAAHATCGGGAMACCVSLPLVGLLCR
jgi:hypothetical protein